MRMPEDQESQDEAELQAPPELVSALKRLPQERPFVPPAVDEAVFRAAQRHLATPEKLWFGAAPWLRWLATAAAVVVLVIVAYRFVTAGSRPAQGLNRDVLALTAPEAPGPSVVPGREPAPAQPGLGPNGQVDILDALRLAKRLQSGRVREPRWDVNGDGIVDERDVESIAAQAVRLDKGGRS